MNAFDQIYRTARSRKLAKDPANALIFGVCAGFAHWLGVKRWFVRLMTVLMLLVVPEFIIVAYAVMALVLGKRTPDRYAFFCDRYGSSPHA